MAPTTKRQSPQVFLGPLKEGEMERSKSSKICPWNPLTIKETDIWRAASGLAVHVSKTPAIWLEKCLCCEVKSDFCGWTGYYKQLDSKMHCTCTFPALLQSHCTFPLQAVTNLWVYMPANDGFSLLLPWGSARLGNGVQGYIVLGLCLCHESLQTKPCVTAWLLCVLLSAGSHEQISSGLDSWTALDQTQGIRYSLWGARTSGNPC